MGTVPIATNESENQVNAMLREMMGSNTLRPPRLGAILLATAMAGAFLGCGSSPDSAAVAVTDSAGTRIVTHASLDDEAFPVIDLLPRVDTIGAAEGAEEYLFRLLLSAKLVPQGIVTADLFNSELRHFDRSGRFVSSVGGRGEGPGEWQALTWMKAHGDSLFFAWDQRAKRLTTVLLTEAGLRFRSTVPVPLEPGYSPAGLFSPARLAVDNGNMVPMASGAGLQRFHMVVSVMNLDAGLDAERRWDVATVESAPRYVSEDQRLVPLPFRTGPRFFFGTEALWLKDGVNGEFRILRMDGALELVVRLPPGRPVTDGDIADFRERNLRNVPAAEAPAMRARLEGVPHPPFVPPLRSMAVDKAAGIVWVRGFPSGDDPEPWRLFDSLGCGLGRVTLPGGPPVLDVAGQRIAVRDEDEMDTERILIYHLAESPPERAGSGTSACGGGEA